MNNLISFATGLLLGSKDTTKTADTPNPVINALADINQAGSLVMTPDITIEVSVDSPVVGSQSFNLVPEETGTSFYVNDADIPNLNDKFMDGKVKILPYLILPDMLLIKSEVSQSDEVTDSILAVLDTDQPVIRTDDLTSDSSYNSFVFEAMGSEIGRARLTYAGNVIPSAGKIIYDYSLLGAKFSLYTDMTNFQLHVDSAEGTPQMCFAKTLAREFADTDTSASAIAMCEIDSNLYYITIALPNRNVDLAYNI